MVICNREQCPAISRGYGARVDGYDTTCNLCRIASSIPPLMEIDADRAHWLLKEMYRYPLCEMLEANEAKVLASTIERMKFSRTSMVHALVVEAGIHDRSDISGARQASGRQT